MVFPKTFIDGFPMLSSPRLPFYPLHDFLISLLNSCWQPLYIPNPMPFNCMLHLSHDLNSSHHPHSNSSSTSSHLPRRPSSSTSMSKLYKLGNFQNQMDSYCTSPIQSHSFFFQQQSSCDHRFPLAGIMSCCCKTSVHQLFNWVIGKVVSPDMIRLYEVVPEQNCETSASFLDDIMLILQSD
ncbi:hypothetical protein OSB04_031099 [Centaurea solstitialis]|uniref:Uncharacterized protein n=1 Tax=Centaurea solstitialis TaxID=347529 RepID=A0AA38SM07_9ASTR|nr:hypothetical protein OSB04_031099 [Centaurea solstitialis]